MAGSSRGSPSARACEAARAALGLGAAVPATAAPVHAVEDDEPRYFLVVLGPVEAPVGVAAVDARTADVMTSARLPGERPHLVLDARDAVRGAGLPDAGEARLVWQPSRQSA